MDKMIPKGKENEMPAVLAEDVDITAAEKLRDVVANLASANKPVGTRALISSYTL